jgi:non-ribosomal peptide synthase protein (TIGR01720 family)
VASRLRERGLVISPKALFQYQTIAELVTATHHVIPAEQGLVTGPVELTPIQRRLLAQDQPAIHHFNLSVVLAGEVLEHELLEQALAALVGHHDVLRSQFTRQEPGWSLEILDEHPGGLLMHRDLTGLAPADCERSWARLAQEAQASMDLTRGQVVRAAFADLGPGAGQRLLLTAHHLVVDAVSWSILVEDLSTAYRQLSSGQPVRLPAKTTSVQAWAARLAEYARSPEAIAAAGYWTRPRGARPLAQLQSGPPGTAAGVVNHDVRLTAEQTRALLIEAPAAFGASAEDVLLASLAIAVRRWSGQAEVLIDVEGHGRDHPFEDLDLSRTVGWFTTLHPVELAAPATAGLAEIVHETAARREAIADKGIGHGILAWLADPQTRRQLAGQPQPDIGFNYFGRQRAAASDGDLARPSPAPSGPEAHPDNLMAHPVEIVAITIDDCFTATVTHQPVPGAPAAGAALAGHYAAALADVIRQAQGDAPGNRRFRHAGLSRDDLAKIAQRLGES